MIRRRTPPTQALALRLSSEQIREQVQLRGIVSPQELDQVLALLEDPGFAFVSQLMMTAWGQRAASGLSAKERMS